MTSEQIFKCSSQRLQESKNIILRRVIDLSNPTVVDGASSSGNVQIHWNWVGVKAVLRHNDNIPALKSAIKSLMADNALKMRGNNRSVKLVGR